MKPQEGKTAYQASCYEYYSLYGIQLTWVMQKKKTLALQI